jgi:UDP-N-acetylmuramoylalanine--D-glutamate ligase
MRFSELEGARVGVWGAGREISSFAAQLARRLPGARIAVAAFDAAPAGDVAAELQAPGVRVVRADEATEALAGCDIVVRSPGVTIHRPELERLRAGGVPVTTATSLWLSEREGRGVLGVTGTKGKSTTAALAFHLARESGVKVHLAGNIGVPALDLLDADAGEPAVVELSSYQIADLEIGPEVAVLTNLFPEHADWHGSEERYRAEKLRLLSLPGVRVAVLPASPPELARTATTAERRLHGDSEGWHATAEGLSYGGQLRVPQDELPLPGAHNVRNLCAALAGLDAAGLPAPALPAALVGFRGLPHRLQTVHERDGVTWVDDSISTTPESTLAALQSFAGRPIVLLGGGQDRGQDYGRLGSALARAATIVIGIPSTGERLAAAARAAGASSSDAVVAPDLSAAVALARARAGDQPGTVVLLSPAAPSYDHFRDFEQRGELFGALARAA